MSDFGLDPNGFNRQRLNEVIEQIHEAIIDAFGAVNLDPDSVLGELSAIVAVPIAQLYQEAENVYFSQYPATAEGTSLDNAVDLVGITRIAATNTRVILAITGAQSTSIPVNSQVEVENTGELFTNPLPGVITASNALRTITEVTNAVDNEDYSIVISGTTITIDSGAAATELSIAAALVAEINITSLDVSVINNLDGTFTITANSNDDAFNYQVGTNLIITSRTSPVEFIAINTGPVLALEGTVNIIVTPVAGWQEVTNFEAGLLGRNLETDQQLRVRRLQSLRVVGAGSVEAIQARLRQNVSSVVNALVFENTEPFEVDGRPPHSFEAVVVGGSDADIAEEIWQVKPAGIQTFGSESVLITDSNGDSQQIRFSRPQPVYIWANVELRINAGIFPANGLAAVALAIKEFGDTFNVGEKIIYQQFFGPIYSTAGILEAELEFATSANEMGPPGAFSIGNIAISQVEVGLFDVARISVTII